MRWCRAKDFVGSQIPVTMGGSELQTFHMKCNYQTQDRVRPSGLGNCITYERLDKEFAIPQNFKQDTMGVSKLAQN